MDQTLSPSEIALKKGSWVKLICGASNQDLPSISDLCALYGTAGVHCIDVAADIAVVNAARKGLDWVESHHGTRPWLMVSISDGEDVHFRKAWFDHNLCPSNCPQPCQKICPAKAITNKEGINENQCYGCGRCLNSCPLNLIEEKNTNLAPKEFGLLLESIQPDALEIHTAPGRVEEFKTTLDTLFKANLNFKRLAISCGIEGHSISIHQLAKELWERHAYLRIYNQRPIWQLDGKPMSGDIGLGTARSAIKLWQDILPIAPPGPLQLAGGTNTHSINYLNSNKRPEGIAFGGGARKIVQPFLQVAQDKNISLTEWPEGWNSALEQAKQLINPWLSSQGRA